MVIRRNVIILISSISVLIAATAVFSLFIFEQELRTAYAKSESSFISSFSYMTGRQISPRLVTIGRELSAAAPSEYGVVFSTNFSLMQMELPGRYAHLVASYPDGAIAYLYATDSSAGAAVQKELVARVLRNAENGMYKIGESEWFMYTERIGRTPYWYARAVNLDMLVDSLSVIAEPMSRFHRFISLGIIGVFGVMLAIIFIMTMPLLRRVDALEKENAKNHDKLKESNLLLTAEVGVRRKIEQELKDANRDLKTMSVTDPLTGIANRRMFDTTLEKEWLIHQREKRNLSLLICDVDFFKKYNDTYGHQKGDECLRRVAAVLAAACRRPADCAARYGGEEFVILLPETDMNGARKLALHVMSLLAEEKIVHEKSATGGYLTVSIGIASMIPSADQSSEAIMHKADESLYRAKEKGRNRFECADCA